MHHSHRLCHNYPVRGSVCTGVGVGEVYAFWNHCSLFTVFKQKAHLAIHEEPAGVQVQQDARCNKLQMMIYRTFGLEEGTLCTVKEKKAIHMSIWHEQQN